MRYQKFDPALMARRSYNYLTRMVDEKEDNLPDWLILPNKKPAEAAHCRVDDAELVGSWYEGLDSAVSMLSSLGEDVSRGREVLESFKRHLLSSWGEHGLRFHKKYPWTHTMHSSFHEMGYILPAMNRPTIAHLSDQNWYSLTTVVDEHIVRDIIPDLKKAGAEGIVEYNLNKVIP